MSSLIYLVTRQIGRGAPYKPIAAALNLGMAKEAAIRDMKTFEELIGVDRIAWSSTRFGVLFGRPELPEGYHASGADPAWEIRGIPFIEE